MKIGILTFQIKHGRAKGSIGSSMIRGDWLAEEWDEAELWTNGAKFDAIIFQKVYWQFFMEKYKGIKILDLCDVDWMRCNLDLVELSQYIDAVTCSSENLTKAVQKYIKKPVYYIPDRLNLKYFTKKKEHLDKAKSVVWFGYVDNAKEVLPQVLPSLARNNLKLYVISNDIFHVTNDYGVEIINVKWKLETAFLNIMAGDFAINPPSLRAHFPYKSNNKTLIAWGLGLPVGNNAEEMERFMDPQKRKEEVEVRWQEIKDKWDIKYSINEYKQVICNIQKNQKNK